MKIPQGGNSFADKTANWLVNFYGSNLLVRFGCLFLVGLPSALIASLYSNRALKIFINSHFPSIYNSLALIGQDYVWIFILIVAVFPGLCLFIGKEIHKRAHNNGLNIQGLTHLIIYLDEIVAYKNNRFAEHLRNADALNRENVFQTITNPMYQISEIVKNLGLFFNSTREKNNHHLIRVVLAVINDEGIIKSIPVFYPSDEPISADFSFLNNPQSAIRAAIKNKDIVLITDINIELTKPKRLRKFAESTNLDDNRGSIICSPVICTYSGKVIYVISIHCEKAGYFKNEFKGLYELILKRFSLRINVENKLLNLKESLYGT